MALEKIPKFDEVKTYAQNQGWITASEAPVQSVDGKLGDVEVIVEQDTEPSDTSVLWKDTSGSDPQAKIYDTSDDGWKSVGVVDYDNLNNKPSVGLELYLPDTEYQEAEYERGGIYTLDTYNFSKPAGSGSDSGTEEYNFTPSDEKIVVDMLEPQVTVTTSDDTAGWIIDGSITIAFEGSRADEQLTVYAEKERADDPLNVTISDTFNMDVAQYQEGIDSVLFEFYWEKDEGFRDMDVDVDATLDVNVASNIPHTHQLGSDL